MLLDGLGELFFFVIHHIGVIHFRLLQKPFTILVAKVLIKLQKKWVKFVILFKFMLHRFSHSIEGIALPDRFTWPFHYVPHPLSRLAADEVMHYVASRSDWHEELALGKMFGVLVVSDSENRLGFLAAFSGNLAGSNYHEYFVPAVYDMLRPDEFFKREETEISAINLKIKTL